MSTEAASRSLKPHLSGFYFGILAAFFLVAGVADERTLWILQGMIWFAIAIEAGYRRRSTPEKPRRTATIVQVYLLALAIPIGGILYEALGLDREFAKWHPPTWPLLLTGLALDAGMIVFYVLLPRIRRAA